MPDSSVRILESRGELKSDAADKPVLMEGTVQDITERWRVKEQLRLNAQVFESSRDGIVITDADNTIASVNSAFSKITGYAPEEVLGENLRLLASKKHDRTFFETMWQQLLNQDHWQGEIWNRRKNGDYFPEWLSIIVVRDQKGQIANYIGIFSDLSEHKKAEERIQYLSNFDLLTRLPNRALLQDRASLLLSVAKKEHRIFTLMYLDLDRFKIVNDSLGPRVGDQLLEQLSERLTKNIYQGDTLCRQGGDDFILLLPDTDADEAAHAAQRLLNIVAQPFTIDSQSLSLTASVGIAVFPQDGDDFERLAQSADAALYRAKKNGRNNFQFFTRQMHEQVFEVLQVENQLPVGLEQGELLLHYQPQVDAETFKIFGAEALIRWQHPKNGLVPPGRFIPIAEESSLIIDVGDWILRAAVRQVMDWQAAGLSVVPVAVNISVVQFRQQERLYQTILQTLGETKLDPCLLELELTESIAMENSGRTIDMLERLHSLGIALSIDDFGTGYSSLNYLKQFKIDKLKIDQSFVRILGQKSGAEAIVSAIIALSKSLGFRTIAEGVETREQLDFLKEKQCDEIQGYFFSKPVPAEAFAELLSKGGILGD